MKTEADKQRHVGYQEEDRAILVDKCISASSLYNLTSSQVKLYGMVIVYWIILQDSKTNHYYSSYDPSAG